MLFDRLGRRVDDVAACDANFAPARTNDESRVLHLEIHRHCVAETLVAEHGGQSQQFVDVVCDSWQRPLRQVDASVATVEVVASHVLCRRDECRDRRAVAGEECAIDRVGRRVRPHLPTRRSGCRFGQRRCRRRCGDGCAGVSRCTASSEPDRQRKCRDGCVQSMFRHAKNGMHRVRFHHPAEAELISCCSRVDIPLLHIESS